MIDTKELRILAYEAKLELDAGFISTFRIDDFMTATNPATVIELLDERDKLIEVLQSVRETILSKRSVAKERLLNAVVACINIPGEEVERKNDTYVRPPVDGKWLTANDVLKAMEGMHVASNTFRSNLLHKLFGE